MKPKRFSTIPGRDPISQLYRAVIRYVEANGGTLAVIGGISIIRFDERDGNFTVGVRCSGKRPQFVTSKKAKEQA